MCLSLYSGDTRNPESLDTVQDLAYSLKAVAQLSVSTHGSFPGLNKPHIFPVC